MTIDECLKKRPYLCIQDISRPEIKSGEIIYILGTKQRISSHSIELHDYQIIKESEKSCVYLMSQYVFEAYFRALSDYEITIKDILE